MSRPVTEKHVSFIGELDVGIGVGSFRVFDANGKLQSESVQRIEIEIERQETK